MTLIQERPDEHSIAPAIFHSCEKVVRSNTIGNPDVLVKFIIDSGATKSVVKLVDHLESLNLSQLPMVASAAGVITVMSRCSGFRASSC
jgi:hypothetical protein